MTNIFLESFDNIATADLILKLYSNISPDFTITTGRTNNGLKCDNTQVSGVAQVPIYKILPTSYSTLIFGDAFKTINPMNSRMKIWSFCDDLTEHIYVILTASGQIQFWRAYTTNPGFDVLLGVSNHVYDFGSYYYFEFWIVFSSTTSGSIQYRVNGVDQPGITGIITADAAASLPSCNLIRIWNQDSASGTVGLAFYHDDMYANDTTGSKNNGYMDDIQVFVDRPTSAVSTTFTPNGAATNPECVYDVTPNYDVNYISSGTPGDVDLYHLSASPVSSGLIKAVQTNMVARKDDALTRQLAPVLGDGVHTPNVGNTVSVGNNYVDYLQTYDQNPLTGADWVVADLATLQVGVKEIA